jgi:hypothetical protein
MPSKSELQLAETELTKLKTRRGELKTKLASTGAMLDEVKRERARAAVKGLDTQQLDKRVAEYLALSETLSDAVREADSQISLSENAVADQRDHAARSQEIATIRTLMEAIETTSTTFVEAARSFRSALSGIAGRHAEALGLAGLVGQIADEVPVALDRARRDLAGYANDLRSGAKPRTRLEGLKPEPKPAPTPRPEAKSSGIRYKGVPFSERHGGF